MEIIVRALNQMFGWALPMKGSVLPGHVIGGHANVVFTYTGPLASFREVLQEPGDTIFPPGHRLAIRLPYIKGIWSLHIPQCSIAVDHVTGHAHVDRGDPDRDVCGIVTHGLWDGLFGHLHGDLDPRPELDPERFK